MKPSSGMVPGVLVRNRCYMDFYPTAESVNRGIPKEGIPRDSISTVLTPPNGTWIKVLCDGKIGWVNWTLLLEVIQ